MLNSSLSLVDYRSKPDLGLFVGTLILVGFGTIMVYSSSAFYAWASSEYGNEFFFLKRHLIRLGIGMCALLAAERLDYHYWAKLAKPLILCCLVLLVAVLVVGTGQSHGASRWLRLSFVTVQPSELTKVSLVLYIASYLASRKETVKNFGRGLLPPLFIVGIVIALVLRQPNFGTAAALLLISFSLLYIGGSRLHHLLIAGAVGLIAVVLIAQTIPYARHRIAGFMSTSSGSLDSNYQLRQSILGMGCGGIFGEGLGKSKMKLLFLPEPHTDFIFAVVAEELGFLGAVTLMASFLFVLVRGARIAMSAGDELGTLLASGLTITIFVYVLLHIAVVVGAIPTTGLPLPFLSFGGSALITNLLSIGILLNISRGCQRPVTALQHRRCPA